MAVAHRLTGDAEYGERAAAVLDAWVEGMETFSLEEDSTLAFNYHFPAMIQAAELLRGRPVWDAAAEQRFAGFLRSHALVLGSSSNGRTNNWANWSTAASTAAAAYLGDEVLVAAQVDRLQTLLDGQMAADGHLEEEVVRNNGVGDYGIWYSHFATHPALLAATIAERYGHDVFGYRTTSGATLQDTVRLLAGWADDPASFPYSDGDPADLADVRTIDYLRKAGYTAHSTSYGELLPPEWDLPVVDRLVAEERPMTTIHATPQLTLLFGDLPDPAAQAPSLTLADVQVAGEVVPGRTVPVRFTVQRDGEPAPEAPLVVALRVGDTTRVVPHALRGPSHQVLVQVPADLAPRGALHLEVTEAGGAPVGRIELLAR